MNRLTLIMVCELACGIAYATDVGLSTTSTGRMVSVEGVIESYQRDIEVTYPDDRVSKKMKDDRFWLRVPFRITERASVWVGGGFLKSTIDGQVTWSSDNQYNQHSETYEATSEDMNPIYGCGWRMELSPRQADTWNMDVFAALSVVPQVDYHREGYIDRELRLDSPDVDIKLSYRELTGGVLFKKTIKISEGNCLIPYGGVALSKIDGDYELKSTWQSTAVFPAKTMNADIAEDELVTLIGGLAWNVSERLQFRVEGRMLSESSVSCGVQVVL
jgi:hypothetical protein